MLTLAAFVAPGTALPSGPRLVVSDATLTVVCDAVQAIIGAFTWTGPKQLHP